MKRIHDKIRLYALGIVALLCGGISLSLYGFYYLQHEEDIHVGDVFINEMDNRYASLDRELNLHKEFLLGLKGLYDASEYVSRTEFDSYVRPALERIGGLQAVEWIPYVPADKKDAYEAKVRNEGFPQFRFTERNEQKQMIPVSERRAYYPVYYVTPMAGNEAAFGFDLGSSSTRLQTLEQSRDTGEVLVTPRITLVQEKGKQAGVLQVVPIYTGNPQNVAERRKALTGFVLGVHRIGDIVSYSLTKAARDSEGVNACLVDTSAPEGEGKLYPSKPSGVSSDSKFYYERGLSIGGRVWKYEATPTSSFISQNRSLHPYWILVGGIVVTLLLASYTRQRLRELRDSQSMTKAVIASSLHCIIMIDTTGKVFLFNPAAQEMFGYSSDEVVGNNVTMLMPEPYRSNHSKYLQNYLTTGHKKIIGIGREVVAMKKDGTKFPIYLSVSELVTSSGERRFVGNIVDITQQKQDEEELKTQRRRLADIIRGTNVGTWEWNVQTGETFFNERWADIIGYTLEELSPVSIDTWMSHAHPDDLEESGELLGKHFNGELEYYEYEARMRHRDGHWVWVLDRGKVASWTDDGKPLLMSGTHKDITKQKEAEEKIRHLATHDTLTDLPTLRLARDRISMAIATAHRKKLMAAVVFVDLDGFKLVNDTLGHDAGDALLKDTATRLLSCVRSVDTVARIGGDEFLIVLNELNSDKDAEIVATKVVEIIGSPYEYRGDTMTVGASVGVAMCAGDSQDIDALIRAADEAMYSIKKSGKNGYAFAKDTEA